MSTNEDLNPTEEVTTNPQEGSESEESEQSNVSDDSNKSDEPDFDELFEEKEAPEGETLEEKFQRQEEELAKIKKGVAKFFSDQGRKKKEEAKKAPTDVIKSLYFNAHPEAKEVWDMVEADAKELKKDPFELYETREGYKLEAKALLQKKAEEEKTKSKILKPSNRPDLQKKLSDIKPEEVSNLKPGDKMKWIKMMAEKERMDQVD